MLGLIILLSPKFREGEILGDLAAAKAIANKINKQLGEVALVLASEMVTPPKLSSGSLSLDIALGGGWPGNKFIEIRGVQSNGKTSCILKTIAYNQERDPDFVTVWVASEPYDHEWSASLGVDNDRVIVFEMQDMTVAYEGVLEYVRSRTTDVVVIDSYPALIAREEEQKGMDDVQVSLGARATNKFIRKLGSAMHRSPIDDKDAPIWVFLVNQFRDAIGTWSPTGTAKTTPGGQGKDYAAYVQVDVKRVEFIEEKFPGVDGKVKVGQTNRLTTVKNKAAAPRQTASIDFYFRDSSEFRKGEYDLIKEAVTVGIVYGVIERRGAFFSFKEDRWQGKESMVQAFREQPDLFSALDREIRDIALHSGKDSLLEASEVEAAESAGEKKVKRSPRSPENSVVEN